MNREAGPLGSSTDCAIHNDGVLRRHDGDSGFIDYNGGDGMAMGDVSGVAPALQF